MGFGSWSQQQAQKNVEISRMHNGFQTTNLKISVLQRENCRIRIIPGGNVTKENCVLRKLKSVLAKQQNLLRMRKDITSARVYRISAAADNGVLTYDSRL